MYSQVNIGQSLEIVWSPLRFSVHMQGVYALNYILQFLSQSDYMSLAEAYV